MGVGGMSITISTDVFCDGEDCSQWTHGTTGPAPNAAKARKEARLSGWRYHKRKDYCPHCKLALPPRDAT